MRALPQDGCNALYCSNGPLLRAQEEEHAFFTTLTPQSQAPDPQASTRAASLSAPAATGEAIAMGDHVHLFWQRLTANDPVPYRRFLASRLEQRPDSCPGISLRCGKYAGQA